MPIAKRFVLLCEIDVLPPKMSCCCLCYITSCRLSQDGIHLVHAGLSLMRLLFSIQLRRSVASLLHCILSVLSLYCFFSYTNLMYLLVDQEFQDTLKYIESIRPMAESYGICRIVHQLRGSLHAFLKRKAFGNAQNFLLEYRRWISSKTVNHPKRAGEVE